MITLILITLAAVAKAVMDTLGFHFYTSILPAKWNPLESWRNKWKDGDKAKGEAFWLSSTALVLFTDAWHFFQFIFLTLIFAAIVAYEPIKSPIIDVLIYRVVFGVTFELFFSKLLIKE